MVLIQNYFDLLIHAFFCSQESIQRFVDPIITQPYQDTKQGSCWFFNKAIATSKLANKKCGTKTSKWDIAHTGGKGDGTRFALGGGAEDGNDGNYELSSNVKDLAACQTLANSRTWATGFAFKEKDDDPASSNDAFKKGEYLLCCV